MHSQRHCLPQAQPLKHLTIHAETELQDLLGGPAPALRFVDLLHRTPAAPVPDVRDAPVQELLHDVLRLVLPHVSSLSALGEAIVEAPDARALGAALQQRLAKWALPQAVRGPVDAKVAQLCDYGGSPNSSGLFNESATVVELPGPLVDAMQTGLWVLLDGFNLAPPGT